MIQISRPFKWIIYTAIVIVVIVTTTFLSIGLDTAEFRKKISETPTPELMDRGRDYYRQNHI